MLKKIPLKSRKITRGKFATLNKHLVSLRSKCLQINKENSIEELRKQNKHFIKEEIYVASTNVKRNSSS